MKEKVSEFAEKVYSNLKKVPKGKVTTYRELAKSINSKSYQAIGQVLRRNPFAPIVPCHRVVKSNGQIGGFMGETNGAAVAKKINLLKSEGIFVKDNCVVDFENKLFKF
ncbi:MGMT family protein [Candidatus Woesearchaeota archaeon]|nr:MGMT family protein [Candidatus Woesearchaeota archaeon]